MRLSPEQETNGLEANGIILVTVKFDGWLLPYKVCLAHDCHVTVRFGSVPFGHLASLPGDVAADQTL